MTAWPSSGSRRRSRTRPASTGSSSSRTPVRAADLDSAAAVTAYKNLKHVERDFRHIKSDDLDLRPVFHRLEKRVKGHVLICMLAAYLTWHLRQAWAPLTYTDEEPPRRPAPSPPPAARHQRTPRPPASTTRGQAGRPYRSFRGLLDHLGTLTRNDLRFPGTAAAVPVLTDPTSEQRQAFDLIEAPIPLTLRESPGRTATLAAKPQASSGLGIQISRNFGFDQGASHTDSCGMSVQRADHNRRSWTICPLLRI